MVNTSPIMYRASVECILFDHTSHFKKASAITVGTVAIRAESHKHPSVKFGGFNTGTQLLLCRNSQQGTEEQIWTLLPHTSRLVIITYTALPYASSLTASAVCRNGNFLRQQLSTICNHYLCLHSISPSHCCGTYFDGPRSCTYTAVHYRHQTHCHRPLSAHPARSEFDERGDGRRAAAPPVGSVVADDPPELLVQRSEAQPGAPGRR